MNNIKNIVKQGYTQIAQSCGCSCRAKKVASEIGYTDEDVQSLQEANLGLGCGNPTAIGDIKEGDVVLDLGCGAGFDVFLAQRRVGQTGKVIGVDMTPAMLELAKRNAEKMKVKNVEFILGDIESLLIDSNSIDIVISNCVINLAPNKDNVFQEAYRVLKKGGSLYVSDIVLLSELSDEQRHNEELLTGCVAGALLKEEYLQKILDAGFLIEIKKENKKISKQQYQGIDLESLSVKATK
ncbi:arsenite S-adenosylmethyltransferase [Candidatus Uhrbacteria bacterium RIFOXYA2_FULL_40_9]|nr:MAG: Transcriptional regulator, ArsR family [Candidatus Uhrbacteria bacterium GW2011_GWF2_40_263]OGL94265.1 MAG: arsenite S-adenosylmethyltransferase [Candidatus Uhrbacteria bacterium RIFOXYA2_FULL_40_9]OGL98310.1 MAG: arsenite S-adenosylmethyltransferase [Candidatus Uhrbacteria bacterium RIFOXYB2_FULL_41_18]HBK34985.1 arsenite S-adenosylmethyltransferase [Candidatus Uhrbacteria bacterium]HCB56027.1 arsenite S-adenosylmethyltransferase [Candidatus Uhrbacteria bacterium]